MSETQRTPQKRCAWKRCRRKFTPTHRSHKHCTRRCGTDAWNALSREERTARKGTKPKRHPKARYIYEAVAEAKPGECPWGCEKQLPKGCRTCCRDRECKRAYQRAYRLGRTEVERDELRPEKVRNCKCGCGDTFKTRRKVGTHDYLPGHRKDAPKKRLKFVEILQKYKGGGMSTSNAGHQWGASIIRGEEYCKRPGCQVRRRHPPTSQLVWLYFLPGQEARRHRLKCQAPLVRA